MTDLAKTADIVLLMIDASYGFEMETFEFLNMLQLHGFPKVMGVLSHLDKFKMNKTLQTTKKVLKNRFWTEIYKGAKMFDMSGVINGKYLKHEIKRLSLHINRVKFRPLQWHSPVQQSHRYRHRQLLFPQRLRFCYRQQPPCQPISLHVLRGADGLVGVIGGRLRGLPGRQHGRRAVQRPCRHRN
jgi:ribosome biogenesis protein BMS1